MGKRHKPRSGSLAFYPKKRAKKETPSFSTFPELEGEEARPVNFLGYKAGMLHVTAKNIHKKSTTYGQTIQVPVTAIEVPNLKVYGVRAYGKTAYGLKTLGEVTAEKLDKNFRRKVKAFKKKGKKKAKQEKEKKKAGKEEKKAEGEKAKDVDELAAAQGVTELRLLVHSQPSLTKFGKKKPDLFELKLSGKLEQQAGYAKEKLGAEIKADEVFKAKEFIDVKAIDKGKGFAGVVKRAGVKIQGRKAKTRRIVGSIGPWHPALVMWTVARPGQLGYQTRTEHNKRILAMGDDAETVNGPAGFKNYGNISAPHMLLAGSVPGPAKRAIALRHTIRNPNQASFDVAEFEFVSTKAATRNSQKGRKPGKAKEKKAEGEKKAEEGKKKAGKEGKAKKEEAKEKAGKEGKKAKKEKKAEAKHAGKKAEAKAKHAGKKEKKGEKK